MSPFDKPGDATGGNHLPYDFGGIAIWKTRDNKKTLAEAPESATFANNQRVPDSD